MCYLFPIGACTAFTGIVAMVSLIAAGGAGFAAAPFFINPDSVTFAVNGHGVCLEPRLDAPCELETSALCGGSSTCCYSGYNCGYDSASALSYCENQCRTDDANCIMFIDGSVDFTWPDVPLRVIIFATSICAIYHLILAVFSVCTGGTARFVAPIIAGFFTTVQLAVVAVAFQMDFWGFYCSFDPLCFHVDGPAETIEGLCEASFNLVVFGGGSVLFGAASVVLYHRRKKFVLDLIAKRDYIPDEELELIEDEGDPGAGWDLDATTKATDKRGKSKGQAKKADKDTAKVTPAGSPTAASGDAAGESKADPTKV